jgi:two-component system nitrogen regulation response regulator GlnG
MRRLAVLERGDTIGAAAIAAGLGQGVRPVPPPPVDESQGLAESAAGHIARYFAGFGDKLPPDGVYDRLLAEVERPLIAACLDATGGNQLKAARLLGINRNTLRKKLTDLELDPVAARRP